MKGILLFGLLLLILGGGGLYFMIIGKIGTKMYGKKPPKGNEEVE